MSHAQSLLPEFDEEMANTRKVLARIPDDKFDWRAHPKSNTIGWNANHLAEIVGWVEGTLAHPFWDIAPPGEERYRSPQLTSCQEVLDLFDKNVAAARQALDRASDEAMSEAWSLLEAGQPLFTFPRSTVIRRFVLNHMIHHRGHLCAYLRLNDIPVPGMYGPSGDELGE